MKPNAISRRAFLERSASLVGGTALALAQTPSAHAARRSAADLVPLGNTGVTISRLGFGTGSMGGSIQRALGQAEFTRLIRYAYDHGIRYLDTAQAYHTHTMIRAAIKGLPREKFFIQTKMEWEYPRPPAKPLEVLDRFRRELDTDYIDSLLIHCVHTHDWDKQLKPMMDAFSEAKARKWIRLKGTSSHGLPALTRVTQVDWCDLNLVRINPQGKHVDGAAGKWDEPGNVPAAMKEIRAMHEKGRGLIGMKIIGNGSFTHAADRERSIHYAIRTGWVNAMVIGFASTAQIDEAIERVNRALAHT